MTRTHLTKAIGSLALAATLLLAGGCSGGDTEQEAAQPAAEAAPAVEAPVAAPTGAINAELASSGESLFQTKACLGCHTVGGGRLAGPDLQGVTERREFDWFVAMVINPDSMLRDDAAARDLLAEYMTPMTNMGVTAQEATALYEYLRRESQ